MLFFERGQTWSSVLKGVLSHCIGKDTKVLKCESWDTILKEEMDGGQVRDCLQDCTAMEGISKLEDAACSYAFTLQRDGSCCQVHLRWS